MPLDHVSGYGFWHQECHLCRPSLTTASPSPPPSPTPSWLTPMPYDMALGILRLGSLANDCDINDAYQTLIAECDPFLNTTSGLARTQLQQKALFIQYAHTALMNSEGTAERKLRQETADYIRPAPPGASLFGNYLATHTPPTEPAHPTQQASSSATTSYSCDKCNKFHPQGSNNTITTTSMKSPPATPNSFTQSVFWGIYERFPLYPPPSPTALLYFCPRNHHTMRAPSRIPSMEKPTTPARPYFTPRGRTTTEGHSRSPTPPTDKQPPPHLHIDVPRCHLSIPTSMCAFDDDLEALSPLPLPPPPPPPTPTLTTVSQPSPFMFKCFPLDGMTVPPNPSTLKASPKE